MNAGNPMDTGTPLGGQLSGGEVAAPNNLGTIMQDMFSQMVSPEQMPTNGQPPVQKPVTLTQSVADPVKIESQVSSPQNPPTDANANANADLNLFTDEPAVEPRQEAAEDDEPDMSDVPEEENPAAENFKKAREAIRNERKNNKILTKEFNQVKSKLEKYEKGETVPEIIAAKDKRIQQLEQYETVVNGKLSDEYQTLVANPIKEKSGLLDKLAQDYQVPENIKGQLLEKIVSTDNEKERNALITKYFPDAIGATKVEALVKELHNLGQVALDLEKKPFETMQTIQAQYSEKKRREAEVVASQFESVSKSAWNKSLEKTAKEGLFANLIIDPTNTEVSKIAESNQHRAAIQYGALVKKLHENGLKTLPEDLAIGLARSVKLSIGGVGLAKELQAARSRIAELEGTNGMIATYFRPGVNTNGGSRAASNPGQDKGPSNPAEAGQAALAVFRK